NKRRRANVEAESSESRSREAAAVCGTFASGPRVGAGTTSRTDTVLLHSPGIRAATRFPQRISETDSLQCSTESKSTERLQELVRSPGRAQSAGCSRQWVRHELRRLVERKHPTGQESRRERPISRKSI